MAHFCAAATRPSGRSAWSIIPPPLTYETYTPPGLHTHRSDGCRRRNFLRPLVEADDFRRLRRNWRRITGRRQIPVGQLKNSMGRDDAEGLDQDREGTKLVR